MINNIFQAYWSFLNQFSPYLLLGFLIAGLLHAFVNDTFIQNNLLGNKFVNIVKATLIGIPLPLCSCGVIPVAMSLYKKGASKSATTSFLISTPQTGVDSIMMTYAMFLPILPVFIVLRPIAALTAGLLGGTLVKIFDDEAKSEIEECTHKNKSFKDIFTYGFITLPQDIAKPLLIGILLASIIAYKPPGDLLSSYIPSGIFELITILILSIPLYVCATASIPIAIAMISKGATLGAALVFLIVGPATNTTSITTMIKILGKKSTAITLLSLIISSLFFGILIDALELSINISADTMMSHNHFSLMNNIITILFLGILLNTIITPFINSRLSLENTGNQFYVSGITCNNCIDKIKASMEDISIFDVHVDLKSSIVTIKDQNIDIELVKNRINSLGFRVK